MQEVAVDVKAVWLRKVLGDELPDGRQILFLLANLILDVVDVLRPLIVTHCEVVEANRSLGRHARHKFGGMTFHGLARM